MLIFRYLFPLVSIFFVSCTSLCHSEKLNCMAFRVAMPDNEILDFDYAGWQSAKAYPFRAASASESCLHEGGSVRFLWNDQHLFVLGEMEDSDIVQECNEDNQHLYKSGDVMEVFVKPPGQPSYWELYVAPNQRKSSFFFPSQGRILPSSFNCAMEGLLCKAKLDGTLNNYKNRSKGWKAIMAISLSELEKSCGPLDFKSPWLLQVGRYNYSYYLDHCELSQLGTAMTQGANFHHFPSYVELEFVK